MSKMILLKQEQCTNMKKIICYGDSNTFGYNPKDGTRFDSNTRWTALLNKILEDKYQIIEEGYNNRTGFFVNPQGHLQSGQKYLPECLERNKSFDIFVLALGTNDMQKTFNLKPDIVKNGLKNIVEVVRKFNSDARIIIIPPVILNKNVLKGSFCHQFDEESIKASNWTQKIYKMVTETENCEFLNLNNYVVPSFIDGLHFDEKSHQVIAEMLENQINKAENKMNYKDKLLKLYDIPINELVTISEQITKDNFKNSVEFCSIISAKTGKCQEDCKYCSQSVHNKAKVHVHSLLPIEEVKKAALNAKENGATRFCIVTSGRAPEGEDFKKIIEMIKAVKEIEGLHSCCSLGILNEKQVKQIKVAGVERYNHNINTSESFHESICSTHEFKDRINTVKLIQKYGIEACTGVIIGMGETREQRVEMALELAKLNPKSVPINFLNPIEGTPLEKTHSSIDEEEILRTICVFRIALPKALLRYAGGRTTRFSEEYQMLGLKAGINALLVGNYLTTTGTTPDNDIKLIEEQGLYLAKD